MSPPQKVLHGGDAREIARKDEEGAEGEQQAVVDAQQRAEVEREQADDHRQKPPIVREGAEDDEHGQHEQRRIGGDAPGGRRGFGAGADRGGLRPDEQAHREDEHERRREGDRHDREKFARRDGEIGVQVQILRIAEGGEHPAQVGGDVLHDEGEGGQLLVPARVEHEVAEGQEGDQRHVVGHDHRPEIGDEHEREHDVAHIFEPPHDDVRQPREELDVLEGGDDGERAEKAGERLPVEIVEIFPVEGDENTGDARGGERHEEHDAALQNMQKAARQLFQAARRLRLRLFHVSLSPAALRRGVCMRRVCNAFVCGARFPAARVFPRRPCRASARCFSFSPARGQAEGPSPRGEPSLFKIQEGAYRISAA